MGERQDSNCKCLVASSWRPSTSVSRPKWPKNRTLDFSKETEKTFRARQAGQGRLAKCYGKVRIVTIAVL